MTRQDMPMLIVYEGELEGQRWIIDQDSITIGRGTSCEIVLPERQVSRRHVQIERDGGSYWLRDLGVRIGRTSTAKR